MSNESRFTESARLPRRARHGERNPRSGVDASGGGTAAPQPKAPGHVEFDSRGNSVWCWDREQDDNTSILLKRLENDALQLEPTLPVPILGKRPAAHGTASKRERSGRALALDDEPAGSGFDPYNSG